MVIPGHATFRHKYRGTSAAIERRMCTGQAKTAKGQTRKASEDQRGSKKITRRGISGSIQVSPISGQHSASTKEGW